LRNFSQASTPPGYEGLFSFYIKWFDIGQTFFLIFAAATIVANNKSRVFHRLQIGVRINEKNL
jgi:hypothetical protein